jgi:hypothetical protein
LPYKSNPKRSYNRDGGALLLDEAIVRDARYGIVATGGKVKVAKVS